jgi:hypothetical protein
MSSWSRSSVATISAPAAPDEDFKACCLDSGRHDGANRHHYFQGVTDRSLHKGVYGKAREDGRKRPDVLRRAMEPTGRREAPPDDKLRAMRSGDPGFCLRSIRATNALDTAGRISRFTKLKLTHCARTGNRAGRFAWPRTFSRPEPGLFQSLRTERSQARDAALKRPARSHCSKPPLVFFPVLNKLTSVRCSRNHRVSEQEGSPRACGFCVSLAGK